MNSSAKPRVTVVKIGGNIVDDEQALSTVLDHFAKLSGLKVLVHGGGKVATELAEQLNLPQTMVQGRRITDASTLKILTMVYGGYINKNLVAALQARSISALGVTGADADLIRSHKRPTTPVDFGLVGDVEKVRVERLEEWLKSGLTPVIAPLTHDGHGQILNTNADTIATAVAVALSQSYQVALVYSFEKSGVLKDVKREDSVISEITSAQFLTMKAEKTIFDGMIPKLENAFEAIEQGVERVILGKAEFLPELIQGTCGTRLIHG